MRARRFVWLFVALAGLSFLFGTFAEGATDDSFCKGKTIRVIVGYAAGGELDAYSRAIARHLGKLTPGARR